MPCARRFPSSNCSAPIRATSRLPEIQHSADQHCRERAASSSSSSDRAARALAEGDVAKRMANLGIEPRPLGPEPFARFLLVDAEKWKDIIRRTGAKAE